jgi:hypothetical protein
MFQRLTVSQTNVEGLALLLKLPHLLRDALELPLETVNHDIDFRQDCVRSLEFLVKGGDIGRATHVVAKTLVLQLGQLLFDLCRVSPDVEVVFIRHQV